MCTTAAAGAQTLALVGGSVYASPDAVPLADAVVVATRGVITAIGSRSDVQIPQDAQLHAGRLWYLHHNSNFTESPFETLDQ